MVKNKKDSVEQWLKDEDFNVIPLLMIQGTPKDLTKDRLVGAKLKYKNMVFWIEDNKLNIQKEGTLFHKDLQDVLAFPCGFKAIQFFEDLK